MPNTFSIRLEPFEARARGVRLHIVIDGQEKFQIGEECLEDSILSRGIFTDSEASRYRRSDLERVIDYGFCTEMCCPSTFAKVSYEADRVMWFDLRMASSDETLDEKFEFDRREYESEVNRILILLVRHFRDVQTQSSNEA
jgi:hypothetical protein